MKRGGRTRFLLVVTVFLLCFVFLRISEAAVTLTSRSQGDLTTNPATPGDYVTLGNWNSSALLWETVELRNSPTDTKQLWLCSTLVLDNKQFNSGGFDQAWANSDIKTWLNGESNGQFMLDSGLKAYSDSGLLSKYTSTFLTTPFTDPGETNTDQVFVDADANIFLLSVEEVNYIYTGNVNTARNDGTGNTKRQGYSMGRLVWTRSPYSGYTYLAWDVYFDGTLFNFHAVNLTGIAVRPACVLNLESVIFKSGLKDFDLGSPLAAEGGQISNPWILVLNGRVPADWAEQFKSADKIPTGAAIDATGKVMTVTWDVPISPAVQRWPVSTDFTLTRPGNVKSNPISVTSDDAGDKVLILTFAAATLKDETVALDYNLNTDAISYDVEAGPIAKVVDSFTLAPANITNNSTATSGSTPGPDDGGSTPVTPSPSAKSPDVRSVTVVIDGTTYEGTVDGDQITLNVPAGTDVSKLNLIVTGYPGATVTPKPPYDFSNGPVKITVKSPDGSKTKDYTITVVVADPEPVVTTILNALASGCTAKLTQNADDTWGVEMLVPFASGFDAAQIETIAASLSGLSNVRFFYVDENGKESEISTRKAGEKSLKITGTAANRAALPGVALTGVSVWKKNDATEYKQSMNLKLSDIPGGKPAEEPAKTGSSSSGCDAGMAGLAVLTLAGGVVIGRRRK